MKLAIAFAAIGLAASSVNAASPYYVGENLKQDNNITLNFQDTLVKEDAFTAGDAANIAAFEVRGAYNATENIPVGIYLPFYMASKDLSGTSRNAMGNVGLSLGWTNTMPTEDREMTWGYNISLTGWMPTSRKDEGSAVAFANPTTDLYRYLTKTIAVTPTIGGFIMADQFSAKINGGYGYLKSTDAFSNGVTATSTDKTGHTFTGQLGMSWHALPQLQANLEYNVLVGNGAVMGSDKYRHAVAPSISGNYEAIRAAAFASIPVDSASRDVSTVALGLNVGYTF